LQGIFSGCVPYQLGDPPGVAFGSPPPPAPRVAESPHWGCCSLVVCYGEAGGYALQSDFGGQGTKVEQNPLALFCGLPHFLKSSVLKYSLFVKNHWGGKKKLHVLCCNRTYFDRAHFTPIGAAVCALCGGFGLSFCRNSAVISWCSEKLMRLSLARYERAAR
jgi:hypothetical protein